MTKRTLTTQISSKKLIGVLRNWLKYSFYVLETEGRTGY